MTSTSTSTSTSEIPTCCGCEVEGLRGDHPGEGKLVPDSAGNLLCDDCGARIHEIGIDAITDMVEGGDNAEDYDRGPIIEIKGDRVWVAWEYSNEPNWSLASTLRPVGTDVY